MKTSPKASAPQPQPKQAGSSAGTVGGVLLSCTLAAGCPGPTTPQVRTTRPPAAPCPEGSVQTMKELGLFAEREYFIFPGSELKDHRELVTVRSGLGVTLLFRGGEWGRLKSGTVFSGEFFVGQERVYGRFTEARTPEGSTYRVCLELFGGDGKRGLEREPGSGTDTANVLSGMMMDAVLEFGAVD